MSTEHPSGVRTRFRRITPFAGLLTISIAALVLFGWVLDIQVLKSVVPGLATMKFNTALGFLLSGAALWMLREGAMTRASRRGARICSVVVVILSGLTLGEYAFGWNLGIDELVVRDVDSEVATFPGRMSAATGICFLLFGLALLMLDVRPGRSGRPSDYLSLIGVVIALIALEGYVFGAQALYQFYFFSSVALHTAILFLVVGLGVLLARLDRGWAAVVVSDKMGGSMARRVLPWVIGSPVLVGWLVFSGGRAGWFNAEIGLAFFASANILLFAPLIWLAARQLNRLNAQLEEKSLANKRLAAIVESSVDAIIGNDLDGRVTSWNRGAETMFGYSAAEMVDQSVRRLIPSEEEAERDEVLKRIREGSPLSHLEIQRRRKDGELIDVSISVSPIRDGGGRVVGASMLARDITDIVQAERELHALEQQRKAVLENLTEGLLIADKSATLQWNPAALRMHGYDPKLGAQPQLKELQSEFALSTLEGQPLERDDWPLLRVIRGEHLDEMELRVRRTQKDWSRVFIYSGTSVQDSVGGETVFLTIRDITIRKRAEEELRLMHARFATVFQSGPVAMSINVVTDGRLIDVNQRYCNMLGYDREELIGHSVLEFEIWADRSERAPIMERLLAEGSIQNLEVKQRSKSGEVLDVLASLELIELATETEPVLISMFIDITERRTFEDQLRKSLREIGDLKTALDEHAIVAITDPKGRIVDVNDKFCAISKFTKEELIGQDHRIINSGFHSKEFIRSLWGTISQGHVWHGEIKNRAKDGSFYWVETTIVPFLDEHGRPRQYVAIRADITDLKNAEETLRLQAGELARSNEDLEQFAYVASHDLQEPLRAVAGCLEVLKRRLGGALDDRANELIGHAVDGANRMQILIEGLLEFSRVGTRGGELRRLRCDDALDDALKNLESSIEQSGAVVTREPLPMVTGDRVQITLLFQNLIGNAIKFCGDSAPRIHVASRRANGDWVISVKDEGIGIEPRYADRIFVIFQRLHTRKEYPGTGLGLAICKKIMERHGGEIGLESELGRGSTFQCRFPA